MTKDQIMLQRATAKSEKEAKGLFVHRKGNNFFLLRKIERGSSCPNPNWEGTNAALICKIDDSQTFKKMKDKWIKSRIRVNLMCNY